MQRSSLKIGWGSWALLNDSPTYYCAVMGKAAAALYLGILLLSSALIHRTLIVPAHTQSEAKVTGYAGWKDGGKKIAGSPVSG